MAPMRNRYRLLHLKIFLAALRRGKISLRKLFNALMCQVAYWRQSERSAAGPLMVSMELGNHCNINCLFCRDEKGVIPDVNPAGRQKVIPKGWMPLETAKAIIEQLKDHLLIAVLYTNGEPLLYKNLAEVVRFATERRVATMIATNGTLLNAHNIQALLEAGLDFVKIALSGFTQDVYSVQVRRGDVEKVKKGIALFCELKRRGGYHTVIMVDYILYDYNRHQLKDMRAFCEGLGVMLNTRPGNPKGGLEDKERPLTDETPPLDISCDWLWKAMQVDWTGEVLPCCECAVWSGAGAYTTFDPEGSHLLEVWNGPRARAMRRTIHRRGRKAVPVCAACLRKGISFKW